MELQANDNRTTSDGPCSRCGQAKKIVVHWPEGRICSTCYMKAKRTHGMCAGCGADRLTPGLGRDGSPECVECSGIPIRLSCKRCKAEELPYGKGLCPRCYLDQLLDEIAGSPGQASPIEPVITAMKQMPRPLSGIQYLRNPAARSLLGDLSQGRVELSHDALDRVSITPRTGNYIREILITHGLLPQRDAYLARYHTWLLKKISAIESEPDRHVIERFGRWHQLKHLRTMSDQNGVSENAFLRAKQSTTVAINFLEWLRSRNRALSDCSQRDIDDWYSQRSSTKVHAETFLYWAKRQRLVRKITVPDRSYKSHPVLGQQQRAAVLRELVLNEDLTIATRTAGAFVLLYGQPLKRVVSMQRSQISANGGEPTVQFGDDALPIPSPISELVQALMQSNANMQTAAHLPTTPWLFPGTQPGKHLGSGYLSTRLRWAGLPVLGGRSSALQVLAREVPPPVLARSLGIDPATIMKHAQLAGSDYVEYVGISNRWTIDLDQRVRDRTH